MRDPEAGIAMAAETAGRLHVRRLDVTDPSTFDFPADLRVLVNNAGIDTDYLPVEHADLDDWRRMFETDVFGVVALTAAAIPTLRANRPSVVCTITSSSIIAAVPFFSAYRASKAAVSAFGDSVRVEVAPFGIRVVEILPGPVTPTCSASARARQLPPASPTTAAWRMWRRRPARRADPRVVDPAAAATAVVDAILDSTRGPCATDVTPSRSKLLDLWRRCDDETVFTMTGQSLLDRSS